MATSTIIKKLHQKNPSLKYSQIKSIFEIIFDSISNGLISNKPIEIRGFGSFSLNYRSPRIGRNPKSGEKVNVPEKYVPHFKAGKELRARVDK